MSLGKFFRTIDPAPTIQFLSTEILVKIIEPVPTKTFEFNFALPHIMHPGPR